MDEKVKEGEDKELDKEVDEVVEAEREICIDNCFL